MDITTFIIGLIVNVIMASLALWRKAVDLSGMIVGFITGTIIFQCGGWRFWIILGGFFVSSSILSRIKRNLKDSIEDMHQRGSKRDWIQVLSNSISATIFSIGYALDGSPFFVLGFMTFFAATNADTWASEIGVFSRSNPYSITRLKPVARGTSGGVSILGVFASLAGSAFITSLFILVSDGIYTNYTIKYSALLICAGGFLGSIVDSILGSTVQAQYLCEKTGTITEKPIIMGRKTKLIRGYRLINNDVVNLLSSTMVSLLIIITVMMVYRLIPNHPYTI